MNNMIKILTGWCLVTLFFVAMAGCQGTQGDTDFIVKISTDKGDMTVILYDETPLHKANFIKLAKAGKYDDSRWHRIIKNFMVQGGNIYEKDGNQEPEGSRLPAEIVPGFLHTKGALAAARQGDQVNPEKKSSSSQFYIVHGRPFSELELTVDQYRLNLELSRMFQNPQYDSLKLLFVDIQQSGGSNEDMNALALRLTPFVEQELGIELRLGIPSERLNAYTTIGGAPHLDNEYTVFGRVVEGIEVIDVLAHIPVGPNAEPIDKLGMKMEVKEVKKSFITEKYGYQYPGDK